MSCISFTIIINNYKIYAKQARITLFKRGIELFHIRVISIHEHYVTYEYRTYLYRKIMDQTSLFLLVTFFNNIRQRTRQTFRLSVISLFLSEVGTLNDSPLQA